MITRCPCIFLKNTTDFTYYFGDGVVWWLRHFIAETRYVWSKGDGCFPLILSKDPRCILGPDHNSRERTAHSLPSVDARWGIPTWWCILTSCASNYTQINEKKPLCKEQHPRVRQTNVHNHGCCNCKQVRVHSPNPPSRVIYRTAQLFKILHQFAGRLLRTGVLITRLQMDNCHV